MSSKFASYWYGRFVYGGIGLVYNKTGDTIHKIAIFPTALGFLCTFAVQWNKKEFRRMRYKEKIKELSVLKRNPSFFATQLQLLLRVSLLK